MSSTMKRLFGPIFVLVAVFALVMPAAAAPAQQKKPRWEPSGPASRMLDASLQQAKGTVEIVVRLVDPSVTEATGQDAKKRGGKLRQEQQRAYDRQLSQRQDALLGRIRALGGKEVARLTIAINAVVIAIDAEQLAAVAKLPGVRGLRQVQNYELALEETVPYVGAAAVQASGFDGTDVQVAVLDSGVDYTHKNLGGEGTLEAYQAAYGATVTDPKTTTRDGLFPTDKVYEGYDFVGEVWPNGALAPDEDPIDYEGHGTHVADIIAGKSDDGTHKGVAPGATVLAVKVCSAVSSSCSGVALLQGVEYALDPNGDGATEDAVDVINMSLGSSYGQREDDLSLASANAVRFGVVVVASAGNSADRPYITGSPASTPELISVAQTALPSDELFIVQAGAVEAGAVWQPWSAPPTLTTGTLQYGDGAGGNLNGCAAFAAGSLAGKTLLVDRGTCSVSPKVSNGAAGGAVAVIVANNVPQAPGDVPPSFSFGGGTPTVPGYTVTQADGNRLKTVLGQTATIDPASAASLERTVVASSSRGPSYSYNAIKPDIGAPGASLSAEAGTGDGETNFGGTSGAAPMVAGAAALLLDQFPERIPAEIKALLMNTGETNILINPVGLPGVLAPITRIGGGELRVDDASSSSSAAWDADALTGSLSFGYHTVDKPLTLTKQVLVRNYSDERRTYTIRPAFRYADDAASGAVTVSAPRAVAVGSNSQVTFPVRLRINPSKLPAWTLDGGANGGSGYLLQSVEFDGYLNLTSGDDNIHLAWQVLPHKASNVAATPNALSLGQGQDSLTLNNSGPYEGGVEVFAWTGSSERIPQSELPQPGDNYTLIDLKSVGVRQVDSALQFAVNTFGERAHPAYPAEFDVYIDSDLNGLPDYVVYNGESGAFASTGQTLVYVVKCTPTPAGDDATCGGTATAYFYVDADLNSANAILTAPLAALGLTPSTKFEYSVYAYDNYFTGALTDQIVLMEFTAGTPRFKATPETLVVPAGSQAEVAVATVEGGRQASPSQRGLLLLYRDGLLKKEAETVRVRE